MSWIRNSPNRWNQQPAAAICLDCVAEKGRVRTYAWQQQIDRRHLPSVFCRDLSIGSGWFESCFNRSGSWFNGELHLLIRKISFWGGNAQPELRSSLLLPKWSDNYASAVLLVSLSNSQTSAFRINYFLIKIYTVINEILNFYVITMNSFVSFQSFLPYLMGIYKVFPESFMYLEAVTVRDASFLAIVVSFYYFSNE